MDLTFLETDNPTLAAFNERFGKLNLAAFLNEAKTAIVDGDGGELLSIPGVKIQTGSYAGTGSKYTAKSLTFSFAPSIVVITSSPSSVNNGIWVLGKLAGISSYYASSSSTQGLYTVEISGNTMTINSYPSSYWPTPNISGQTYYYTAIG